MNNILTILITTYNRDKILHALLSKLYQYQKQGLNFNILVSDDQSTDTTQQTCSYWGNKLNNFIYIVNNGEKGMDGNFQSAYEACQTEYCWLLGDTRYITFEELQTLIELLSTHRYNAIITKCHPNMKLKRKVYTDINTLMLEQGWQITNNASCVIPKSFINKELYNRYFGTTFLHLGIFVENLCLKKTFRVLYESNIIVKDLQIPEFKKIGWTRHPFLNFGKLWFEFIMALPNQIKIENKFIIIKNHQKYTKFFALSKIPGMKIAYGKEYIASYKENRQYMHYISTIPTWMYDLLILYTPSFILSIALNTFKMVRHKLSSSHGK